MQENTDFLASSADLAGLLALQVAPNHLPAKNRTDDRSDVTSGLLASRTEIVGLLAGLAESTRRTRHSSRDAAIARSALSAMLSEPEESAPISVHQIIEHAASLPQRAAQPRVIDKAVGGPRKRAHCACGKCQWCLDNARWERIFNEKFADPGYYRSLKISHNSCLSGAR